MNTIKTMAAALLLFPAMASAQTIVPQANDKGKWGFVDADGKEVIKPTYTAVEESPDGAWLVAEGGKMKDGVLEGEKWGVLDASGKLLIKPEYNEIGVMQNGLVQLEKGGKKGFADAKWEIVIPVKFDFVGTPNEQGFVWVNQGGKFEKGSTTTFQGGKFGVYRADGKEIVPAKFTSVGTMDSKEVKYDQHKIVTAKSDFQRLTYEAGAHLKLAPAAIELRDGYKMPNTVGFAVSNKKNVAENGVYSPEGELLVKPGQFKTVCYPTEGWALATTKKNVVAFVDVKTGKATEMSNLKNAYCFKDGYTECADKTGKWRFYDTALKPVGDTYNWISPRNGTYYIVNKSGEFSLLNAADLSPVFSGAELIFPAAYGYMAYKDKASAKWGYLDANTGQVAKQPVYDHAFSFMHGTSLVASEGKWGAIDTDLNEHVAPVWKSVVFPNSDGFGYLWVETNGDTGNNYALIDWQTGKETIPATYTNVNNFIPTAQGEMATVEKDGKWGVIQPDGTVVIPMDYSYASNAAKARDYKIEKGIDQWRPIDSYRFFLTICDPSPNSFKLSDRIPTDQWDY